MATTVRALPSISRALRAAIVPMETWSSWLALDGMESTLAGWASTLFSETREAAAVLHDHEAGIEAAVLHEEGGQPVRQGRIDEPLDAALRDVGQLRARDAEEVHGQGRRAGRGNCRRR